MSEPATDYSAALLRDKANAMAEAAYFLECQHTYQIGREQTRFSTRLVGCEVEIVAEALEWPVNDLRTLLHATCALMLMADRAPFSFAEMTAIVVADDSDPQRYLVNQLSARSGFTDHFLRALAALFEAFSLPYVVARVGRESRIVATVGCRIQLEEFEPTAREMYGLRRAVCDFYNAAGLDAPAWLDGNSEPT